MTDDATFLLPEPFRESTAKFLLCIGQYVWPCQSAEWDGKGVAVIEQAGGLQYRWHPGDDGVPELTLAVGAVEVTVQDDCSQRHQEPTLALLLRAWYELGLRLGVVSEGEHADALEQVETVRG